MSTNTDANENGVVRDENDPPEDHSSNSFIKAINSVANFFTDIAEKAKDVKNYKQTIIFLVIIFAFTFLVAYFSFGLFKYLNKDAEREALKEAAIESILGIMHDPQNEQGRYHYGYSQSGRAPNGLYPDVEYKKVFQRFDSDFSVLRLWVDPRNRYAMISANLKKSIESDLATDNVLIIKFIRAGWGVDVAIKQEDNKTAYTGKYNKLVVKALGDTKSFGEYEKSEYEGLAFRLRIIDGRGTHWVWGDYESDSGEQRVSYNTKDDTSKPLKLTDKLKDYYFDISTRKKWVRFLDDGGIAPPKISDEKIDFIQAVIIEPGWALSEEENAKDKYDLVDHDRHLGLHDTIDQNSHPKPATMEVHAIYFAVNCE